MSSPTDPRPLLSAENSETLNRALHLSEVLQAPATDAEARLTELKSLIERGRRGVRRQKPRQGRQRLQAIDQARNYLHFLPNMQHSQAAGRLRSVSRRLRRALKA